MKMLKQFILVSFFLLATLCQAQNNEEIVDSATAPIVHENKSLDSSGNFKKNAKLVYVFEINEMIAPPIWRKFKKAHQDAANKGVNVFIIQMNTYGGLVDMADSIRTRLLHSPFTTASFITNNAASAGALISLACDSIYMKAGSTIGAATVVGGGGEKQPEKMQSYFRKKMKETAQTKGRNPDIAVAMVDEDFDLDSLAPAGKLLTLTSTEAVEHDICDAKVENIQQVIDHMRVPEGYTLLHQELTWVDQVIGFLINPIVSGILIMAMLGGLYFEFQSPGVGFPLGVAIVAAVLYFAPHYLEGLANHWEILLFIAGLVLIGLEVFVIPGFGVAGISGIVLCFIALVVALVPNVNFDFSPVSADQMLTSIFVVILSVIGSTVGSIALGARFIKSHMFQRLVLQQTGEGRGTIELTNEKKENLVGKTGVSHSILRPGGKVEIDGTIYDALAVVSYIDIGEPIRVVSLSGAQVIVEKLDPAKE